MKHHIIIQGEMCVCVCTHIKQKFMFMDVCSAFKPQFSHRCADIITVSIT